MVGVAVQSIFSGNLRRSILINCSDQPAAVVASQNTSSIIATGQHESIVQISKSDVLITFKMCKGSSQSCIKNLDNRGIGVDFKHLIDIEASIERIHFSQRCKLSVLVDIASPNIGTLVSIDKNPSFGSNFILLHYLLTSYIKWHHSTT